MSNRIKTYTLSFVIVSLIFISKTSFAQPYACLPTCETADMRFFIFSGPNLDTFIDARYKFGISSPASSPTVEIGIFDGDDSESNEDERIQLAPGVFITDWDQGGIAVIRATLYADPEGIGDELIQLAQWFGDGSGGDNSGFPMPDNNWFSRTLDNIEQARSANGNFRYTLVLEASAAEPGSINQFKIRTDGSMAILPGSEFAFFSLTSTDDDTFIAWPNLTDEDFNDPACFNPVTFSYACGMQDPDCCLAGGLYDGSFTYFIEVPEGEGIFNVWDGDFDYGSASLLDDANNCIPDNVDVDTDDFNTPPAVPEFAQGTGAEPEGERPANPNDDICVNASRWSPSVIYNVTTPTHQVFLNDNPSGNREWELFNMGHEGQVDFPLAEVPGGIWTLTVMGLDWGNLAGLRLEHPVIAVNDIGGPVPFDPEEEISPVPTLNEWALVILSAMLGIFGLFAIRRKKATV